jgi:hypothetical protein
VSKTASLSGRIDDGPRPKALPTVLPPEEYDRPFDGILLTHRLNTAAEIRKVYPQGNLGVALGCVWKLREGCLIVMVADEVIRSYKLDPDTVRRHEMGIALAGHPATKGRGSSGTTRRNDLTFSRSRPFRFFGRSR